MYRATIYPTSRTTADQIDKGSAEILPNEQDLLLKDHFQIFGRLPHGQTHAAEPSNLVGSRKGANHGGPRAV